MKRVSWSTWFFIAFWVFAPLWFGPIIYNDLIHPELWNDWMHNPRWYMPLLLLSMAVIIAIFVAAFREQRRWDKMTPKQRYEEAVRRLRKGRRR